MLHNEHKITGAYIERFLNSGADILHISEKTRNELEEYVQLVNAMPFSNFDAFDEDITELENRLQDIKTRISGVEDLDAMSIPYGFSQSIDTVVNYFFTNIRNQIDMLNDYPFSTVPLTESDFTKHLREMYRFSNSYDDIVKSLSSRTHRGRYLFMSVLYTAVVTDHQNKEVALKIIGQLTQLVRNYYLSVYNTDINSQVLDKVSYALTDPTHYRNTIKFFDSLIDLINIKTLMVFEEIVRFLLHIESVSKQVGVELDIFNEGCLYDISTNPLD